MFRRKKGRQSSATPVPAAKEHQERGLGDLRQYNNYDALATQLRRPYEVAVLRFMANMGGVGSVRAMPLPKEVRVIATNFDDLMIALRQGHFLWAELYAMPAYRAPASS